MPNWFKKSQFEDQNLETPLDFDDSPIRYRVMIPVDVWVSSTGDDSINDRNAYDILKNILERGASGVDHQGFRSLLQPSDIKTYRDTMRESNIG